MDQPGAFADGLQGAIGQIFPGMWYRNRSWQVGMPEDMMAATHPVQVPSCGPHFPDQDTAFHGMPFLGWDKL
jgi:hypothetical protein